MDPETDAHLQVKIRREFAHCTVLTIAHRINSIIDSDRILVMDAGRIREYDTPEVLLNRPGSMFRKMVDAHESFND